jgi:Tfp pilus assembly protein PilO
MMIATIVVSSGLCYMQYNNYSEKQAEVDRLRKEQLDESEVKARLEEATAKVNESKVKLSHLEQGVPEIAYVPTLLKELERTGKESGIEVTGVRPIPRAAPAPTQSKSGEQSKKAKKKDYTELDIQVSGRGDYRSVMNFIKALALFPKILATRTISVQPMNNTGQKIATTGGPTLNVVLEFRAYLFPSDGSIEKAEASEAPAEKTINVSNRNKGVY